MKRSEQLEEQTGVPPARIQPKPRSRYRMLVSDIDGTLLTSDSCLPEEVLSAIADARQAGIIVTLATGRRYVTTEKILRDLGFVTAGHSGDGPGDSAARAALDCPPVILQTGAVVVSPDGNDVLFRDPLPRESAHLALQLLIDAGLQPIVYENRIHNQRLLTGPAEYDSPGASQYLSSNPQLVERLPYDRLIYDGDPLQIAVVDSRERLDPVMLPLDLLDCRTLLSYSGNLDSYFMEVFRKGCTKGQAVERLARHLGFGLFETVCIGDNKNDLEMLAMAGCGVAVANADAAVAPVARRVTVSNDDHAVAHVLRQMLAGEEPGTANPAYSFAPARSREVAG